MNKEEPKTAATPVGNPDSKKLTPWQKERLRFLQETDKEATLPPADTGIANGEPPETQGQETTLTVVSGGTLKTVRLENDAMPEAAPSPGATDTPPVKRVKKKKIKDLPKSKSFADKLPKMRETRKKRLKRRLSVLVGGFGIAALGTIYYVSPLSNLDQIVVAGNTHVSDENIAFATHLTREDRIWTAFFQPDTVANIKKANPRVKTVKVGVTNFNSLKLTVTEFAEVAYVKDKDILHPVLENGKILTETSEVIEPEYPVLIGFTEGTMLNELLEHFDDIEPEIRQGIEEIKSTPKKRNKYLMTIKMADGNQILTSSKDFYTKINYYPKVVAEMDGKGLIDMEAGIFATTFEALKKQEKTESSEKAEDNLE